MKSVAVASLFVSVALAASSSIIPDGISTGCSSYLTKLNGNTTLSACTSSLIAATKAFQPGSTGSASASDVQAALTTVCSTSTQQACQSSTLRAILADFYAACPAELVASPNKQVIALYDALYVAQPFREAVCARDDSGKFCALQRGALTTTGSASAPAAAAASGDATLANGASLASVQKYLGATDGSHVSPNATTFSTSNVGFLFLQAELASDKLCTACTRQVMSAYIDFETLAAYAPGLGHSALLPGQTALYKSVLAKCGGSFLQSAVQAAGSLGEGLVGSSSGAERVFQLGVGASAAFGLLVAFVAL